MASLKSSDLNLSTSCFEIWMTVVSKRSCQASALTASVAAANAWPSLLPWEDEGHGFVSEVVFWRRMSCTTGDMGVEWDCAWPCASNPFSAAPHPGSPAPHTTRSPRKHRAPLPPAYGL